MINYPSYLKGKHLKWLRDEFLYAVMHMLLINKDSTNKRDVTHAFKLGCSFTRCNNGVLRMYRYDEIDVGKDILNEVHRLEQLETVAPNDNL
jgi:hypothetical protein